MDIILIIIIAAALAYSVGYRFGTKRGRLESRMKEYRQGYQAGYEHSRNDCIDMLHPEDEILSKASRDTGFKPGTGFVA